MQRQGGGPGKWAGEGGDSRRAAGARCSGSPDAVATAAREVGERGHRARCHRQGWEMAPCWAPARAPPSKAMNRMGCSRPKRHDAASRLWPRARVGRARAVQCVRSTLLVWPPRTVLMTTAPAKVALSEWGRRRTWRVHARSGVLGRLHPQPNPQPEACVRSSRGWLRWLRLCGLIRPIRLIRLIRKG